MVIDGGQTESARCDLIDFVSNIYKKHKICHEKILNLHPICGRVIKFTFHMIDSIISIKYNYFRYDF